MVDFGYIFFIILLLLFAGVFLFMATHEREDKKPKGTLHLFRDEDGIYMQLELNDSNIINEISESQEVIFSVERHF